MTKQHINVQQQLHAIEEELIQLSGLIKALKQIEPDESEIICLTNAITQQLRRLEEAFCEHWRLTVHESK